MNTVEGLRDAARRAREWVVRDQAAPFGLNEFSRRRAVLGQEPA